MTTATLAMLTPTNMMFMMFILLLMFGAKKLPELARGLGQAMKEFSKAKNEIHDEILRDPAPTSQMAQQPPAQIPAPGMQPQPAPGTYAQAPGVYAQAPGTYAQPAPAPAPGVYAQTAPAPGTYAPQAAPMPQPEMAPPVQVIPPAQPAPAPQPGQHV